MPHSLKNKFEVFSIEKDADFEKYFAECLTYPNIKVEDKIQNRFHYKYFLNYLWKDSDGLKAQTILLEKDYTSASYLGDYINYYAHCYRPYLKQCRRVHFFKEKFDEKTFIQKLTDKSENEKFWDSYLGYIVVKPLPKGVIGATLLKPYNKKDKRFYTAKRKYPVNIFGKTVFVESLPYQEQDGIVGSCASSALWFAFQKTRELFHSSVPNPSDITISAGYDSFHTGKSFPSNGLEITQICKAVNATGLISELRVSEEYISDDKWLKSFVYAYSRMGIPILMGIDIEKRGAHLITLNGYRFANAKKKSKKKSHIDLKLLSNEIIKFYAHDDQTGPFSRVEFVGNNGHQFNTSWWDNINSETELGANTICVIVPLLSSIKVTFENILEEATILDFVFDKHLGLKFSWDIYLAESNKYKEEIRNELIKNGKLYDDNATDILFESLPQYVWVAKAYVRSGEKDFLIFDLLYDAIDVNYKKTPYYTNIYNPSFKETLDELSIRDEFSIFRKTTTTDESKTDLYTILTEEQTALNSIESVQEELHKKDKPTTTAAIIEEIKKDGAAKDKFDEAIKEEKTKIRNKLSDFNSDIDERI